MKTLTIIRHGKSSWEDTNTKDIDRPLLAKGVRRTHRICKYMKKNALLPDSIITSPAARAIETTNQIVEELSLPLVPQVSRKFYPGRIEEILDAISELDNDLKHLLIVGHNPVLTSLVQKLAEHIEIEWLPTSGLVSIAFKIKSWEYIANVSGDCIHFITPKELKAKSL